MKLEDKDVELFYKLYWSLLFFVNQKYNIIKGIGTTIKELAPEDINKINEKLWKHPEIIDSFITENKFNLSEEELEIVRKWKNFVSDRFVVIGHSKQGTLFLQTSEEPKVYAVLGLASKFDELLPFLPIMVETVLLPFKGKITYCSFFSSYNVTFGKGVKETFELEYNKAKATYGIITSLDEPPKANKGAEEELFSFYVRSERNRWEYQEEINKLLKKNPSLWKTYYHALGKTYALKTCKKLSEMSVLPSWFAVLDNVIIASGQSEADVKAQIERLLPKEKWEYVYVFNYKGKHK